VFTVSAHTLATNHLSDLRMYWFITYCVERAGDLRGLKLLSHKNIYFHHFLIHFDFNACNHYSLFVTRIANQKYQNFQDFLHTTFRAQMRKKTKLTRFSEYNLSCSDEKETSFNSNPKSYSILQWFIFQVSKSCCNSYQYLPRSWKARWNSSNSDFYYEMIITMPLRILM